MTKRERVLAAIRHQEPDIVPYEMSLTWQAREILDRYLAEHGLSVEIDSHIHSAGYSAFIRPISGRPGFFADDFGLVWNRTGVDKEIGVIDNLLLPEPTLDAYAFPTLDAAALHEVYATLVAGAGDAFRAGNISFTMFERAWSLRGMENLLMDMVDNAAFVDDLLDAILAFDLEILEIAFEHDIDGFLFGDDWGQQRGLIMGPTYWRRFIKPRMAELYAYVRRRGKIVMQHSCGDIGEILPDLVDIGLQVYQTFQPEIYDIGEAKRQYAGKLAFWGGISTQRLLPFATPDEIRRVTRRTMDILGKGGGYIAAPTHGVPSDIPPENLLAMLEVFQNQPPGPIRD